VRVWIDARAPAPEQLDGWRARLEQAAIALRERTGVGVELAQQSRSDGVTFDAEVRGALLGAARAQGVAAPEVVCFAGHDAGVVGERLPAGMVLVRNARGVSHAPREQIDLGDAAVAATLLLQALEELS
jgi:acetylornithine deacetylase/succinyl-diaminopimelate desuccinylase-like protein